jgi:inorganic pyrophosphatase
LEIKTLNAIACTVDILKQDTEIKLLVGCSDHEIEVIKNFYTSEYMSAIILKNREPHALLGLAEKLAIR